MPIGNCTDEDIDYDVQAIQPSPGEATTPPMTRRRVSQYSLDLHPRGFGPGDEVRFYNKEGATLMEAHFFENEVQVYARGKLVRTHKHRSRILLASLHKNNGTYRVDLLQMNQARNVSVAEVLGVPACEVDCGDLTVADWCRSAGGNGNSVSVAAQSNGR